MQTELDLSAIAETMASDISVRERIADDYAIDATMISSADSLRHSLLQALNQTPVDNPIERDHASTDVFRAAVAAIGSNSRDWAVFNAQAEQLSAALESYDPDKVHAAVCNGSLDADMLRNYFSGQTGASDAQAVLKWAKRLSERDFMDELHGVARAISAELAHSPSASRYMMPCLAVCLATPAKRWVSRAVNRKDLQDMTCEDLKLAGMGPTLASEFLRNLKFDGFKPDRHVIRLLDLMAPQVVEESEVKARELAAACGRGSKETINFLKYSLAGQVLTPRGTPYSEADNLLWALGHYVEKKGHESADLSRYLRETDSMS